jgi:hypothetical protein
MVHWCTAFSSTSLSGLSHAELVLAAEQAERTAEAANKRADFLSLQLVAANKELALVAGAREEIDTRGAHLAAVNTVAVTGVIRNEPPQSHSEGTKSLEKLWAVATTPDSDCGKAIVLDQEPGGDGGAGGAGGAASAGDGEDSGNSVGERTKGVAEVDWTGSMPTTRPVSGRTIPDFLKPAGQYESPKNYKKSLKKRLQAEHIADFANPGNLSYAVPDWCVR